MAERRLSGSECVSAAAIQEAIDALGPRGGRIVLPEMDLVLDRGIELRSGVELVGQGAGTILRKGPGRTYPLTGYHNYGMCDVPVHTIDGLAVGMTVSVLDDLRRGFYSTLARITRLEDGWVGLDHGIRADYLVDANPRLTLAHPLVFGIRLRDAALRDVTLDGSRDDNPDPMDACRGAAVYFAESDGMTVRSVQERGFNGEGLGFQMCSRTRIVDCEFHENTGNGFHPGAGSTDALFENCVARGNAGCGFFFCVRANHVTVRGCTFERNAAFGVSIGCRDCFNLVEACRIVGNDGPGIHVRDQASPTEVHACRVTGCTLDGNARRESGPQVEILGDTHDIAITGNTIIAGEQGGVGIDVGPRAMAIFAADNRFEGCRPELAGEGYTDVEPAFECGCEDAKPRHSEHLALPGRPGDAV